MRKLAYILLFVLLSVSAFAQNSGKDDLLVSHYTEQNGLLNNIVNCSLKDKEGFMWFGTWYGLTRFDGTHFQNFSNAVNIVSDQPPRKIETIVEDGQGNIWIKTLDWKLSVFFKRTERFENIFDELKPYSRNLQIIKIQSTPEGRILLLTKDKSLLQAYTLPDGRIKVQLIASSRGKINTFDYQLKDNLVDIRSGYAGWVGKDYRIFVQPIKGCKWTKKQWYTYFQRKSVESNVYKDRFGCLWTVGTTSIKYFNPRNGKQKMFPFSYFGRVTSPSFCDAGEHGVFYLTEAGEALYIDRQTLEMRNVATLPQLRDEKLGAHFFSMNIDRDGILWLSSTNNGIYRFNFPKRQFRIIPLPPSDKEGVRSLFQLKNGDVLVGTRSKNLYLLDINGKLKFKYSYDKYHIGSVYYIMADHKGNLWLSTKGDGLVKAIPDKNVEGGFRFVHYLHNVANRSTISGNNVYITYEDSHRRIWVGTLDGGLNLIVEHGGKIEFKNKYNGMKNYPGYGLYLEVRNMVEDRHGRIWVGTIDGLMSFDANFDDVKHIKFDSYRLTETNTLANSDVYALYKDHRQNIWVCMFGGGLSRISGYDKKQNLPLFKSLGKREGLRNDVIVSILEDNSGRLWLGNDHGLSCYNPVSDRIRNFDNTDGFPQVDMEETSSLKNSNGELWMGCKQGILAFRPGVLKTKNINYPVYIVGCQVNNRDIRSYVDDPIVDEAINYVDRLELKYNQSMFTLEFAALNFHNNDGVNYRYMLEGYDKDWHYNGSNRIASYTNVPPGDYTFIVQAIDTANPGKMSSCKMQITVLPPWWATWWAYTFYLLIFMVTAYFVIKYAKYQLKMKNDIYIQTKVSEFKKKFYLEQQDKLFVDNVSRIIDSNLVQEDFDIELIAKQLGMSRSSFFKRLKSLTGLSPSDFVKERKLACAVELLKTSELSIADIAYKSGFSDSGYFGKCFRKRYGVSPREFINSQK